MLNPRYLRSLDALGSVTAQLNEETRRLEVRGLPCRDFQHRGFDIKTEGKDFPVVDELGEELGCYNSMDEAMAAGVEEVAGIDLAADPPPLRGIGPGAARACRDWSVHLACFGAPPTLERQDTLQAILDAMAGECLVALEALPGAGAHAVLAELARQLLDRADTPGPLQGCRVLELDWLKLNAGQTRSGALAPGERLAQVLTEAARGGHLPVIPRGRAQELAQVLPAKFRALVLCNHLVESRLLPAFADVVRIRLPELDAPRLRLVLASAARALEAELGVVILDETLDYLVEQIEQRREESPGPMVYQVAPGALTTMLRIACERERSRGKRNRLPDSPCVIAPPAVGMELISFGVNEESVMNSLLPTEPRR